MEWELVGRVVLCCLIIAGGLIMVVTNVNYKPEDDGE